MNAKRNSVSFREHKALGEEHINLHFFEKDYNQS